MMSPCMCFSSFLKKKRQLFGWNTLSVTSVETDHQKFNRNGVLGSLELPEEEITVIFFKHHKIMKNHNLL